MMKESDEQKLLAKTQEWEQISRGTNADLTRFVKHIKIAYRQFVDSLMFMKKPSNKIDRLAEQIIWWFKIVIIFFALKGITYWMTGR